MKIYNYLLLVLVLGLFSCQKNYKNKTGTDVYYKESTLSFFDPYNNNFERSTWIRNPDNIKIAHETFKKIGYKKLFNKYNYSKDWCWIIGDVNKPCNEVIDSLLLTYPLDTIASTYYREFWSRRKTEKNDQVVYAVLKDVQLILKTDSIPLIDTNKVNDTLFSLIKIREFEDSMNLVKAKQNFDYLKSIGLHHSAFNLLFERHQYDTIAWNKEALRNTLQTDTTNCCPLAFIEDDTK